LWLNQAISSHPVFQNPLRAAGCFADPRPKIPLPSQELGAVEGGDNFSFGAR
jgi:hypothetical protein